MTLFQRAQIELRPNIKVIIHLPNNLTLQEAKRLKTYIDLSIGST